MIGRMIGATFFMTFTTPFTIFFTVRAIFLKKNSRWPVNGLIEFASDPTIYAFGSAPSAAIPRMIAARSSGLFSTTSRGTIISRSEAWTTKLSPPRPICAMRSAVSRIELMPDCDPKAKRLSSISSMFDVKKEASPPSGMLIPLASSMTGVL